MNNWYKKIHRKSYFVADALAYIIDEYNKITKVDAHISSIIDIYNLHDKIESDFKNIFGEDLDWDKDWDTVVEFVKDLMQEKGIFSIVVDLKSKQVFVRPRLGEKPSSSQIKELSDWAIEHGWKEDIIIDVVAAYKKYNWYKTAQEQYYYALNCTDLKEGISIEEMVDKGKEISWKEFNKHVSNQEIRSIFGDHYDYDDQNNRTGLKIQNDPYVYFYKSFYKETPCYYLDHSRIEYIFLSEGKY